MGKRPAGARHIRTSANSAAAPAPGFSRRGAAALQPGDEALDGLLTPGAEGTAVDPALSGLRAVITSAEAMDALLAPGVAAALDTVAPHPESPSEADQAAIDLDAILSMAFGIDPEPAARPLPAAGPLPGAGLPPATGPISDDVIDELFGDWDLGGGLDDFGDETLAENDDLDLLFDLPSPGTDRRPEQTLFPAQNPGQLVEDAEIVADTSPTGFGVTGSPDQPAASGVLPPRSDLVPAVGTVPAVAAVATVAAVPAVAAAAAAAADPRGAALPDLDLDDLFDLDPAPPPRSRGRAEDFQPSLPKTAPGRKAPVPELDRVLKIGAASPSLWARWRSRILWALILAGMVYVAFLPYPYEVGGDFVVQPLQRSEARSRTDGEIMQVNEKEGNWVKEGDILAVLSNWDELRDVALNQSDDAKLRADLATMENGAKPEEIAVAREAVSSAELLVSITQKDLVRQQVLFDSGTIAEKLLDTARNAHDAALSARDEASAKLALVASAAKPTEIDAQKAAIARNQQELDFARLMLEYANVRAPQAGQIVSSLSTVPVGAFLPQGGLFAELENNRIVIAEVDMPETYIKEVALGAKAELRLWSDPETSIFGTVRSVAPRAEERDFGWVIRVEVEVPNPDGRLAANMTGYGKVAAAERPVWQAFTEVIVGFFKIELWSWVP